MSSRNWALPVATMLAVAGYSADARAQDLLRPEARQGYFIGGGLRGGFFSISDEDLGSLGGFAGFGGQFRLGQMSTEKLGFGLVIGGGSQSNATWKGGGGGLLLEGQLRPMADLDLAIRVGLGIGGMGLSRVDPATETDDDPSGGAGALYSLGISWDWFPFFDRAEGDRTGGFALTPFAEAQVFPTSDLMTFSFVIGIETTWWSGVPDNKLELPPEEAFKKR
ncbi:hypothetical protein L6R52_19155 [Myxococcota bacterium]|nr:hypothetical protein [Myxococcota bacterium]